MPLQDSNLAAAPRVSLIVGCGYLGTHLARLLLERGDTVYGSVRTPQSAFELSKLGVRPLILDVTQKLTLAALRPVASAERFDYYHLIPPGSSSPHHSPSAVVLDGLRNVLAMLPHDRIRSAVMASSTAVYGQSAGERITADTPPHAADDRARMLLESESIFLNAGPQFRACRLAGLYGPGRVIGLAAVREGSPIAGNPDALLNLIHVADAASLLRAIADGPGAARIELGCDSNPTRRIDYYRDLARRIGAREPGVLDDAAAARLGLNLDRLRRSSSKSCDNTPTRNRTGWEPRYADFRAGLADCIAP